MANYLLSLRDPHVDGEVDELGVFLYKVLDGLLLEEVICLFLHVQTGGLEFRTEKREEQVGGVSKLWSCQCVCNTL